MATTKKAPTSNAGTVFNTLTSKGYSKQAAAGVVGNLQQESGVNPTKNQTGGGPGRGIAQWESGARWETLKSWAGSRNPNALSTQTDFMLHEMQGLGLTPNSAFGKSTSVSGATRTFETVFERAGTPNMPARLGYAQSAYSSYAGSAAQAPATKPSAVPHGGAKYPLVPKSTPAKPAPPGKPAKKTGGGGLGEWLGNIPDNITPDNIGGIPDAITPDNLGGAVSGAWDAATAVPKAVTKFTETLFSVSFWIRAAFIIVGITLVFIGTKALLTGSAPQAPSMPTSNPAPTNGGSRKPYGSKAKGASSVAKIAEVA